MREAPWDELSRNRGIKALLRHHWGKRSVQCYESLTPIITKEYQFRTEPELSTHNFLVYEIISTRLYTSTWHSSSRSGGSLVDLFIDWDKYSMFQLTQYAMPKVWKQWTTSSFLEPKMVDGQCTGDQKKIESSASHRYSASTDAITSALPNFRVNGESFHLASPTVSCNLYSYLTLDPKV